MVFPLFCIENFRAHRRSITLFCSILLLFVVLNLINPAGTRAQSAVVATSKTPPNCLDSNVAVPNSLTAAQISTETMLTRPVATIGIRSDERLAAAELFDLLDAFVFIDINLEGVLDGETEFEMKAGVSIGASLRAALRAADSSMIVESDGSISIISIDDKGEPDYLRNVTYDVTRISGSLSRARELSHAIMNTIYSDSWEINGGGNGAMSIYTHDGHVLMTINQGYPIHMAVRRHFNSVANLSGVASAPSSVSARGGSVVMSAPSSVVSVPAQQTTNAYRTRRGLARPNSGTSGGLGGGGNAGGGLF